MITILGATGNVGGKIAAGLAKRKEPVRVVARTVDRLAPLAGRYVTAMAGDIGNRKFLREVLKGADAVFTMIPPNPTAPEFLRYAEQTGENIAAAVEAEKVKHVVNLSSIGAEIPSGTGPIAGLHALEVQLNRVKGLNVMHLRAAYFMENLLWNIGLIREKGIAGSAVRGDLKIPMIATKDIAAFAAERLSKRDFAGSLVRYLLGERDLTLADATAAIGTRIGKPDLSYITFPYGDAERAMVGMGLSPDMSRTYIEMARAFNEGRITVPGRDARSTTPTSIEAFCDEVFVPLFAATAVAKAA